MKEEENKPSYNLGELVLGDDGAMNKVLGFISNRELIQNKWIYKIKWNDDLFEDEPYEEKDLNFYWDNLQQQLNS